MVFSYCETGPSGLGAALRRAFAGARSLLVTTLRRVLAAQMRLQAGPNPPSPTWDRSSSGFALGRPSARQRSSEWRTGTGPERDGEIKVNLKRDTSPAGSPLAAGALDCLVHGLPLELDGCGQGAAAGAFDCETCGEGHDANR